MAIINRINPGDLITADLMNFILDKVSSVETRVIVLEQRDQGSGAGAATGFIELRYKNSARGIQLVPGDAIAYPNVFTVVNNTDRTLNIQLSASVISPHGDWFASVQIIGSEGPTTSISLTTGASQDITVAIKPPGDAQIGDQAQLTLNANVGPPHNKQAQTQLQMTVAAAAGAPITRSVIFSKSVEPAATDNVPPSTPSPVILQYAFDLRYAATTAPLIGNFVFTVNMTANPPDTLGDWFVDFGGAPRTNSAPGVFSTPLALDANSSVDARVTVRVRTPLARGAVDKTATLTMRVDSTDLPQPISAIKGPFNLRLTHS